LAGVTLKVAVPVILGPVIGEMVLAHLDLDLALRGPEYPGHVARGIGVEAHGDHALDHAVGALLGALGGAAIARDLAEQLVERHGGKAEPHHAGDHARQYQRRPAVASRKVHVSVHPCARW
jgi:hypothetical protein